MNRSLKAKIFEKYGTQTDFATAVGVDDSLVSKIIRGRKTLNPGSKRRWAVVLDCDVCIIFPDESKNHEK